MYLLSDNSNHPEQKERLLNQKKSLVSNDIQNKEINSNDTNKNCNISENSSNNLTLKGLLEIIVSKKQKIKNLKSKLASYEKQFNISNDKDKQIALLKRHIQNFKSTSPKNTIFQNYFEPLIRYRQINNINNQFSPKSMSKDSLISKVSYASKGPSNSDKKKKHAENSPGNDTQKMKKLLDQLKALTSISSNQMKRNKEGIVRKGKQEVKKRELGNSAQYQWPKNNSLISTLHKCSGNENFSPKKTTFSTNSGARNPEKKCHLGISHKVQVNSVNNESENSKEIQYQLFPDDISERMKKSDNFNSELFNTRNKMVNFFVNSIKAIQELKLKVEKISLENSELKEIIKSLFEKKGI